MISFTKSHLRVRQLLPILAARIHPHMCRCSLDIFWDSGLWWISYRMMIRQTWETREDNRLKNIQRRKQNINMSTAG